MDQRLDGTQSIAAMIGIGLRAPHFGHVESAHPSTGWLEVHAENFMDDGPALARLARIACDYPLSLHGVGLSLGTADGIDQEHLKRFKALITHIEPFLISDHLSWSVAGGTYLNDLLPLPYTEESLAIVAKNIAGAQDLLGRRLLIENPSRYLQFRHSTIPEPEFLGEIARRTGCGILCDVNNVFVTCTNLGLDADAYLDALPASAVGELHLAGHSRISRGNIALLIDDHASAVSAPVWRLYLGALERFGRVPTLIEWDKDLPPFDTLLGEAQAAMDIAKFLVAANAYVA